MDLFSPILIGEKPNIDTQQKDKNENIEKGLLLARTRNHLAHGILLGPASCSCLILISVCLVHMSNLWHQRIIRIGIRQQRTDWKQHLQKEKKTLQIDT